MPRWAPSEAQVGEAGTGAQPHPGRAIQWPRPQHCRPPTGRSFPPGRQPQGPLLICWEPNLLPWNLHSERYSWERPQTSASPLLGRGHPGPPAPCSEAQ